MNLGNLAGIFSGLKSLFGGTTGDSSAREKIEQQVAGAVLPSLDDEAIETMLDVALEKVDPKHLKAINALRKFLEPHQRDRWRKIRTSVKLPEKFEDVDKTTTTPQKNGAPKIEVTKERRQRNYAFTAEDPRIEHLVLVAKYIRFNGNTGTKESLESAREYLISAGYINRQSVGEKASDALKAGKRSVQLGFRSVALGDEYERIMKIPNLSEEERSKLLDEAMRSINEKEEAKIKNFRWLPAWYWIAGFIAFVIILELGARSITN